MAAGSQQQTVGERGTGVQNIGDGNTIIVYAGRSELRLVCKQARKTKPTTELQLLRVDLRATTLVGRKRDLSSLEAWLASDRLISVRCIAGRAGIGKTRVAIELCANAKPDWTAGFTDHSQFSEFVKHAGEWRWNKPTLVVIDYAAALARDLRTWLEILARPEAQTGSIKLRLLLLERHAERDFGWWADLMRIISFSDPAPDELADPPEPVPLPSLDTVEDRWNLLAETMRLAGQIVGVQTIPRPPPPGVDSDFDRRLRDDTINNEPLYLMMAGAEAIRTGAPAALALTRTDLAERAASRERERLDRLTSQWGHSGHLIAHLVMCVTLQGGCSAEEALQLITEERHAMGFPETVPALELVNQLAEALPGPSGVEVDAVRPDLIGEAFLLQGMEEYHRFPRVQADIVERAWRRADRKVAAILVRSAQDYAQGDADHRSVVWLRHLLDLIDDLTALVMLAAEVPQRAVALREFAAAAEERVNAIFTEAARRDPELRPLLASSRSSLAFRLFALGRHEPAFAAAEEALAIHHELAAQWPDAFRPDHALSLNNLATILSELGRREAALATAEQAAVLYRKLAQQQSDAFRPALATSLSNFANMLSDIGRHEPALAAAEEAVAIRRELAAQRPDAFRPDLALSLNNLAKKLSDLGRREAGLAAAQEAANLYRELAGQRPDAFRPDLSMSLNNLAKMLSSLGLREPALAAAEKSVAIRRELAGRRPDAFRPDLVMSLNNLAVMLSALGRREPALAATQEAVGFCREMAGQRPDAFRPDLARSLNNLALMLSDLGWHEPALAAAQEAAALYRELAGPRPDAFRPDLAMSLYNVSKMLSAIDRHKPALKAAVEAVAIRRELAGQIPDAFRPDLAASLAVQANCLDAVGRVADALESNIEGVVNLYPAFEEHPAAFSQWMVPMVQQYLGRCERLSREPDVDILRPIVAILQGQQSETEEQAR